MYKDLRCRLTECYAKVGPKMDRLLHRVRCPFCLSKFLLGSAPFRCVSKPCPPIPDSVLGNFYNCANPPKLGKLQTPCSGTGIKNYLDRFLRLFFPRSNVICSVCSQNTEQWACPQCHSHIPKNIQQTPSRTFVIIGDTKKAFEESLIFRLQEGLGLDLGIQIKETEAGPCPEHPSLYEIATSNPDQKPLSVSFLKLSEKEFLDKTKRKRYGKLLSKASGIICLIDPEGLPGFSENGKTTALPVEKLAEGIQNLVKASLFRMSMPPVAFALSSLEKLAPLLPSTNLLLHPSQYRGGYNEEDGKSLSREVMGHIGTWAGPRVLRLLESLFPKYRFFCYSLNYEGYSLRVEDAFLWHLTKLDILQVKSRPETYDGPKLVVNENVRSQ